jgi:hypothetical protein
MDETRKWPYQWTASVTQLPTGIYQAEGRPPIDKLHRVRYAFGVGKTQEEAVEMARKDAWNEEEKFEHRMKTADLGIRRIQEIADGVGIEQGKCPSAATREALRIIAEKLKRM